MVMCEASIWTWSIRSSSVIIIFLLCFLIVTGPGPGLPVVLTVVGNFSSFSSCCGGGDGSVAERGGILKSLKSNQDWKFPSSKAMESEDSSRNKITKQNRTFSWTKKQYNLPVLMCLTCIFTLTSETMVLYAGQHQLSLTEIRPNFIAREGFLIVVGSSIHHIKHQYGKYLPDRQEKKFNRHKSERQLEHSSPSKH